MECVDYHVQCGKVCRSVGIWQAGKFLTSVATSGSRELTMYRSLQNPCNIDCINFHIWKLVCTCSSIVVVRMG